MTENSAEATSDMPLMDHLKELRSRFIVVFGAFLIFSVVAYLFSREIYAELVEPLAAQFSGQERRLIYTGLAEAFLTYLKLSFFTGLIATLPVALYQVWRFISPGLYSSEKRLILTFLFFSPLLFIVGAGLAYFGVIPLAWNFFLSFESGGSGPAGVPIVLEARVSEYLSLTMTLILAFGLAFQLPVVLGILAALGVIKADILKKGRKYAFLGCLIFAAFLTPPDIVSQLALGIPLFILYEISIWIAVVTQSRTPENDLHGQKVEE